MTLSYRTLTDYNSPLPAEWIRLGERSACFHLDRGRQLSPLAGMRPRKARLARHVASRGKPAAATATDSHSAYCVHRGPDRMRRSFSSILPVYPRPAPLGFVSTEHRTLRCPLVYPSLAGVDRVTSSTAWLR